MPTFTAIALDNLIEPGASETMAAGKYDHPDSKSEDRNYAPNSNLERVTSLPISMSDRGINIPKPPRIERRNSVSTTNPEKKRHSARISPALYATPESTPLPVVDSASSFPPSPYIINHKRRGPRLLKSFSEDDVVKPKRVLDEETKSENEKDEEREQENAIDEEKEVHSDKVVEFTFNVPNSVKVDYVGGVSGQELASGDLTNGLAARNGPLKSDTLDGLHNAELDDFFDPQDSMSAKSNADGDTSTGVERSFNFTSTMSEFYDAREELSSESGPQPLLIDPEAELREIRLNLLMEIEKQKQAEEALNDMRNHWLRIREHLSTVGLTLPSDPISAAEDEQMDDPAEEICRQVTFARYVSNSIGRGTAKAEIEAEMESRLEAKNFEIARLWDRLKYYEAVNREMSQRNQEVVETARHLRQRRKRRQRWMWGSIAAAVTLGTTALAWSYLPTGKGSYTHNQSHAQEGNQSSK